MSCSHFPTNNIPPCCLWPRQLSATFYQPFTNITIRNYFFSSRLHFSSVKWAAIIGMLVLQLEREPGVQIRAQWKLIIMYVYRFSGLADLCYLPSQRTALDNEAQRQQLPSGSVLLQRCKPLCGSFVKAAFLEFLAYNYTLLQQGA